MSKAVAWCEMRSVGEKQSGPRLRIRDSIVHVSTVAPPFGFCIPYASLDMPRVPN